MNDQARALTRQGRFLTLRWCLALLVGEAIGAAVVTAFFFVVLAIPFRQVGTPLLLLIWAGVPLPGIFLWARSARAQPRRYALRTSIGSFVFLEMVAIALGLGAIHVGLDAPGDLLSNYAPITTAALLGVAVWIYFDARKRCVKKTAE